MLLHCAARGGVASRRARTVHAAASGDAALPAAVEPALRPASATWSSSTTAIHGGAARSGGLTCPAPPPVSRSRSRRARGPAEDLRLAHHAHCANQHVHVQRHSGADRVPGARRRGERRLSGSQTHLPLAPQEGTHTSFEYGRYGNPTTRAAEDKIRCAGGRRVWRRRSR